MKIFTLLTGMFILFVISACEGDSVNLPCQELTTSLITVNVPQAAIEINAILDDFPPVPTEIDPLGHEENLKTFVKELRAGCSLNADIDCYGCIETFPVQSHVHILLDSTGTQVHRVLDILTPGNGVMTMHNIHQ